MNAKTKRIATIAILLMMTGMPQAGAAEASCSGDPCADVDCRGADVTATANGSEYSHAVATAGGTTDDETHSNGGRSDARMNGGEPRSADAKGKKDWSFA